MFWRGGDYGTVLAADDFEVEGFGLWCRLGTADLKVIAVMLRSYDFLVSSCMIIVAVEVNKPESIFMLNAGLLVSIDDVFQFEIRFNRLIEMWYNSLPVASVYM